LGFTVASWEQGSRARDADSGDGRGQVENQVGLLRERFFTPRLRVKSYQERNAWLLGQCVVYAKAHRHPELREQTVWEMFEAERPSLVRYGGRFDGFHAVPASDHDPGCAATAARACCRLCSIR
jgi:hypothetical protein